MIKGVIDQNTSQRVASSRRDIPCAHSTETCRLFCQVLSRSNPLSAGTQVYQAAGGDSLCAIVQLGANWRAGALGTGVARLCVLGTSACREPNWSQKAVAYGSAARESHPEHAVPIRNERSCGLDLADCRLGEAWAIKPCGLDSYGYAVANELPVGIGGSA